jgi:hypothetical protein
MIRPAVIAVLAFLVLGVVILLVMGTVQRLFATSPPGQYPLETPRQEWPVTEQVRPFRPGPHMGVDVPVSTDVTGPKVACVIGSTPPCILSSP